MSDLLIYLIFAVMILAIVITAIILFHKDAIFTIAIGTVIGANIYNAFTYPINIGEFVFGFDSIIYSIFLFCMFVFLVDYGKKTMKVVLYTALFSIFLTAVFSFFGTYLNQGELTSTQIWNTLSYVFSIIATYICVIALMYLYEHLKKKNCNIYLNFFLCMITANLVNSAVYFGLTFAFGGDLGTAFVLTLAGSAISKFIMNLICLQLFYFNEKYWKIKYINKHPELKVKIKKLKNNKK